MPYRLYALSNAGSMFALISYPVLFEPVFGTHQQASIWSIGVWRVHRAVRIHGVPVGQRADVGGCAEEAGGEHRPGARQYVLWLALPACASVLLLAITNHLSQNVAAIPFLWVLPLSIYLLTFILCFEGSGWYRRNPYLQLLAVALGSMAFADTVDATGNVPIKVLVPLFCDGAVHLLHGLPRRAGAPQAAPALPDPLLPDDFGGRRGGRPAGGADRAARSSTRFTNCRSGWPLCAVLTLIVLQRRSRI